MDKPHDYQYWKYAVQAHPEIFGSLGSAKHDIQSNREAYRSAGVIIEIQKSGTGERHRVLISPSTYMAYWRERNQGAA